MPIFFVLSFFVIGRAAGEEEGFEKDKKNELLEKNNVAALDPFCAKTHRGWIGILSEQGGRREERLVA